VKLSVHQCFTLLASYIQPYRKIIYILALLLSGNLIHQIFFLAANELINSQNQSLNLLAIIWLALVNLMLNVFTSKKEITSEERSLFKRMKDKISHWLRTLLALIFLMLSLSVIFLTIRMLRI